MRACSFMCPLAIACPRVLSADFSFSFSDFLASLCMASAACLISLVVLLPFCHSIRISVLSLIVLLFN